MDLSSAITQMSNNQAAKTPSMNGYVKREDYENNSANAAMFASSNDDTIEAVFQITFVENPTRTGGTAPTQYSFTAKSVRHPDGSRDAVVFDPADQDTMSVDAAFMQLMISREWSIYTLSDVVDAVNARTTGRW